MIARHEAQTAHTDVWTRLASPLPQGAVAWRQDGRTTTREGKQYARFVAYIDANTVRERLDAVVPGEWSLALELLPPLPTAEEGAELGTCAFKARLQILGVVREDIGTGRDYKQAATDAFKRVAVRFGVGHELYAYDQNWVQVDGEGRSAKPLEDPQTAYDRRHARAAAAAVQAAEAKPALTIAVPRPPAISADVPPCPKCGGRMWDNRIGKRNPKAPDFKCRDRGCDGVIWPPRGAKSQGDEVEQVGTPPTPAPAPTDPAQLTIDDAQADDVPF